MACSRRQMSLSPSELLRWPSLCFLLVGNPFHLATPVSTLSQCFLNSNSNKSNQYVADHHHDQPKPQEVGGGDGVKDLNQQLTDLLQQLEIEKKRGKELDKALKKQAVTCRYNKTLKKMGPTFGHDDIPGEAKSTIERLGHRDGGILLLAPPK